jgi:hypothetical protein
MFIAAVSYFFVMYVKFACNSKWNDSEVDISENKIRTYEKEDWYDTGSLNK